MKSDIFEKRPASDVSSDSYVIVVRNDSLHERDARKLEDMIINCECKKVYVDCRRVRYFSSAAIGVLLSRASKIKENKEVVFIIIESKDLNTLLTFVGVSIMYQVINVAEGMEDSLLRILEQ